MQTSHGFGSRMSGLAVALTVACSSAEPEEGGRWIDASAAPFVVRFEYRNAEGKAFSCTGSKVGSHVFLTAGHCLRDKASKVRLFDPSQENFSDHAVRTYLPPKDAPPDTYDIAFFAVDEATPKFGLAQVHLGIGPLPAKFKAYGFGCGDQNLLREFDFAVASEAEFAVRFPKAVEAKVSHALGPFLLSARAVRACPGDSGGPLVSDRQAVIAVVSSRETPERPEESRVLAVKFDEATREFWVRKLREAADFADVKWLD